MNEKPKILIVDDEADLLEALELNMKLYGFEVCTAPSGNQGFQVFTQENVDAIVTDIKMPDGNGIELLKRVKGVSPALPVVSFITGYSDLSIAGAYNFGASGTMSKPFVVKDLSDKIEWDLLEPRARWRWDGAKDEKVFDFARPIAIGRGGLCVETTPLKETKKVGDVFQGRFELDSAQSIQCEFWLRWVDSNLQQAGIEIKQMESGQIDNFLKYIEEKQPVAYIPCEIN